MLEVNGIPLIVLLNLLNSVDRLRRPSKSASIIPDDSPTYPRRTHVSTSEFALFGSSLDGVLR